MVAKIDSHIALLATNGEDDALDQMLASGLASAAKGAPAHRLAQAAIHAAARHTVTSEALTKLRGILTPLSKQRPRKKLEVVRLSEDGSVVPRARERMLVDPAIVELLLSLEMQIELPSRDPRKERFSLYDWGTRGDEPLDELVQVGADPYFGAVLVESFGPTRMTKDEVGNWLERASRMKGTAGVFEWLDAFAKTMLESWTLGALDVHRAWIEGVCQPAVFARCPALVTAVRELGVARLLRNQLRAGIMDEWGWPAKDEALGRIAEDRREKSQDADGGPYPYEVLFDQAGSRVIVIGPEGIVADRNVHWSGERDVRRALYVTGDVLVCEYPDRAQWVFSNSEPFTADCFAFSDIGCELGLLTHSRELLEPGATTPLHGRNDGKRRVWFDGETYYEASSHSCISADGSTDDGDDLVTFRPKAKKRPRKALPAWMRALVSPDGHILVGSSATFVCVAPKDAAASPLGARNGLGGAALHENEGKLAVTGIDGRCGPGMVNDKLVVALMTFPGRDGFYPVIEDGFDIGVAMPDGTTPLMAPSTFRHVYWAGGSRATLLEWHMLRPRDVRASEALSRVTDAAAQTIVDATSGHTESRPDVVSYGNMQVVVTARPSKATKAAGESDRLGSAIRQAIPEVTHPRMVAGIGGLALLANRLVQVVLRLKSRVPTRSSNEPTRQSIVRNADVGALAELFDHDRHWWIEKLGIRIGQQMLDVSRYCFDETSDELVTPAPTILPWQHLITRVGEVIYRVLAAGTPKQKRTELVSSLRIWRETAFPSQLECIRLVELGYPSDTSPDVQGLDHDYSDRLLTRVNRYFFRVHRYSDASSKGVKVIAVEATRDGVFRVPKGATLLQAWQADTRFDGAAIDKALRLVDERGPVPFDVSIGERIASKTGLGVAASTLLWAAGYDPWLTGDKKIARFGIDRASLDVADKELHALRLREIYARAMPEDPELMYDGALMAGRLAADWNAHPPTKS